MKIPRSEPLITMPIGFGAVDYAAQRGFNVASRGAQAASSQLAGASQQLFAEANRLEDEAEREEESRLAEQQRVNDALKSNTFALELRDYTSAFHEARSNDPPEVITEPGYVRLMEEEYRDGVIALLPEGVSEIEFSRLETLGADQVMSVGAALRKGQAARTAAIAGDQVSQSLNVIQAELMDGAGSTGQAAFAQFAAVVNGVIPNPQDREAHLRGQEEGFAIAHVEGLIDHAKGLLPGPARAAAIESARESLGDEWNRKHLQRSSYDKLKNALRSVVAQDKKELLELENKVESDRREAAYNSRVAALVGGFDNAEVFESWVEGVRSDAKEGLLTNQQALSLLQWGRSEGAAAIKRQAREALERGLVEGAVLYDPKSGEQTEILNSSYNATRGRTGDPETLESDYAIMRKYPNFIPQALTDDLTRIAANSGQDAESTSFAARQLHTLGNLDRGIRDKVLGKLSSLDRRFYLSLLGQASSYRGNEEAWNNAIATAIASRERTTEAQVAAEQRGQQIDVAPAEAVKRLTEQDFWEWALSLVGIGYSIEGTNFAVPPEAQVALQDAAVRAATEYADLAPEQAIEDAVIEIRGKFQPTGAFVQGADSRSEPVDARLMETAPESVWDVSLLGLDGDKIAQNFIDTARELHDALNAERVRAGEDEIPWGETSYFPKLDPWGSVDVERGGRPIYWIVDRWGQEILDGNGNPWTWAPTEVYDDAEAFRGGISEAAAATTQLMDEAFDAAAKSAADLDAYSVMVTY